MSRISFIAPELRRLENVASDAIVLYCFDEMRPFRGITSLIDWRFYNHLSRMVIEGFYRGEVGAPLLMPLGRHLPQSFLLLVGLGSRDNFGEASCTRSLEVTFNAVNGLRAKNLALALPGRPEGICPPSEAIEWFLTNYDALGGNREITLIEPQGAQKAMLPSVERWRLRHLMP